MKLFMCLLSLFLVGFGAYACLIERNPAGVVVLVLGGLTFMAFISVKNWQKKADKSLYK